MGFDKGCIVLDSENSTYFAGQTVNGQIKFDQGKDKTIHGIYVSLKGFCKVHWTTTESRRRHDKLEFYQLDHTSYEEYVNKEIFVFGRSDGDYHLKAGSYEFEFSFDIPQNCPSSFLGSEGHIRYRIKAVMLTKGLFSSDKELMEPIGVVAETDLNEDPDCQSPIEFEMFQSYCCWCFNSGSSELRVKLPQGGYCPGQIIPIEIDCKNNSSVKISRIAFAIQKKSRFIAVSAPAVRSEKETVMEVKKGPVPAHTARVWTLDMQLPDIPVPGLRHCQYINIEYDFQVTIEVGGCHSNQDEKQPIVIGTIPLVGHQDDVEHPLHDHMPQQIEQVSSFPAPIMYQPLPTSPYPNNQPYPNSTPYPAVNAPYPTTPNISVVPPYPNTPVNQPYPNVNPVSPYPAGNLNSSPYPLTNQPFPVKTTNLSTSPYPQNNQAFPGGTPNQNTSPYPQNNQGYPGFPNQNDSPYPQGNQFHPNNQSYPPINPPYPGNSPVPLHRGGTPNPVPPYHDNRAVTSSNLVKTGTLGFRVPGEDGVSTPLLPPGAHVPYPLRPASPYASASAPEPSTPDSVDNNLSATSAETSNPPYNPEFMNAQKKNEK